MKMKCKNNGGGESFKVSGCVDDTHGGGGGGGGGESVCGPIGRTRVQIRTTIITFYSCLRAHYAFIP